MRDILRPLFAWEQVLGQVDFCTNILGINIMKITVISGVALALSALAPVAVAGGDIAAGKDKAFTCSGCHGNPMVGNVYPTYDAPLIGGQSATYIVAALKQYADDSRWHPTMRVQAKSMSDQDMADIAAYLESLGK
jgi:cytochrome c553